MTIDCLSLEERKKLHEILRRRRGSVSKIARAVPCARNNVHMWLANRQQSANIARKVVEMAERIVRDEEEARQRINRLIERSDATAEAR